MGVDLRHCPLAGQLGVIFAELSHKIGVCRLPIGLGPAAASQLFACWNAITDLRIDTRKWVLASDGQAVKGNCEIVSRFVFRARIRPIVEKSRRQMGPDYSPRDEEGNVINEPSDDELPPPDSGELLLPQRPFRILGPTWNALANPAAPKREPQSPPPAEPDSKVPRVDGDSCAQDDLASSPRYTSTPRLRT